MAKYDIKNLLETNSYPGRGIILGRSADDKYSVAAYFIMGRSNNSRNRIFTATDDGIKTEAFDPAAMEDPSLIIYHPVRQLDGKLIVTNGDQTDTIRDGMLEGPSWDLYARLKERFGTLKITVSGGVSSLRDAARAEAMGLDGIIIGKALYENRITLNELKTCLQKGSVPV